MTTEKQQSLKVRSEAAVLEHVQAENRHDGTDDFDTAKVLFAAIDELKRIGINEDSLTDLNDSGYTFDEITDYLDRTNKSTNLK